MENKKLFDAFGHELFEDNSAVKLDHDQLAQYVVELDPKTGVTRPVIAGYEDMTALIQSYKNSCGMEYVQRMLRTGQLTQEAVMDDGRHSGDGTMPTQLNVAFMTSQQAKASGKEIADALGLGDVSKLSTDQLTALIQQKITDALSKQTAPQPETAAKGE